MAAGGGGMAIGVLTLGGLSVGPAALVAGFVEMSNATRIETEVEMKIAEMKVARVQIKQQFAEIEIARRRINELHESVDETDKSLQKLLDIGSPTNVEDAYKIALVAKTLGELLDAPITDEDGKSIKKDCKR